MFRHEIITTSNSLPFRLVIHRHSAVQITKHWHQSVEINYTIHGDGDYLVAGKFTHISDNDFILINSNDVHGVENIGPGDDRRSITILIPYDEILRLNPNFDSKYFLSKIDNQSVMCEVKKELYGIYESSKIEDKKVAHLRILGHYYLLMSLLFQHFLRDKKSVTSYHDLKKQEKIQYIINFLTENYREKITLEDVAKKFGFSRSYLDRLFKQIVGTSLIKYIQLIRLNFAYQLITETEKPIALIADECGFSNTKSMQKLFKQNYGMSPTNFRKNLKSQ